MCAHFLHRIVRKRKRPKAFGNFHAAALDATGPADRSSAARVTVGSAVRLAHICAGTRAHLRCSSAQVRQSRQGLGMGPTPSRMRPTSPAVAHKASVPVQAVAESGRRHICTAQCGIEKEATRDRERNQDATAAPRMPFRPRAHAHATVGGRTTTLRHGFNAATDEAELRRIGATCTAAKGAEARPRRTLP